MKVRAKEEAAKGAAAGWQKQMADAKLMVWFGEEHGARASGGSADGAASCIVAGAAACIAAGVATCISDGAAACTSDGAAACIVDGALPKPRWA